MATPNQRRARLSIDVEPGLRRRIKIAAATRDLSVREYVEGIVRQALASDAPEEDTGDRMIEPQRRAIRHLTEAEQQRGLRALAALERFRDDLAAQHGTLAPESWELLNASRDDRTREVMRAVEE
jgi:hypothetical protein